MTDVTPAPRKPRRPAASSGDKRLLTELLDMKDQMHALVVSMERFTNMHASNQMIAQRDIAQLVERVGAIDVWISEINTERSEQRGAAKSRKSFLAIIAGLASIAGAVVSAVINWLLRGAG